MSVSRQLAMNKLCIKVGLPLEIYNEIMSFCFYDIITAKYLAEHKKKMEQIIWRFEIASITRAKPYGQMIEPDTCEHWAICLSDIYLNYHEAQLQATNCKLCGNYKKSSTFDPTEEQIIEVLVEDFGQDFEQLWLEAIPISIRCYCNR
jgi:hypothetical protein